MEDINTHFCKGKWKSVIFFDFWAHNITNPVLIYRQDLTVLKMVGIDRFELPTSCSQSKRSNQADLYSDKMVGNVGFAPLLMSPRHACSYYTTFPIKFMVCDYLILFPNDIVDKSLFLQFIETLHH